MKIHKITFALCALVLTMNSCNFLQEDPLNRKPANEFWGTVADAESAVNALYFGGVPYMHDTDVDGGWTPKATMWTGIMSGLYVDKRKDRTFTTSSEAANYNVEAFDDTAEKLWQEFYIGISRANFVIANIPLMEGLLDDATIENYVAQGKFFRAYGYFWLVKEFGDVPYVSEPYTSTEGMFVERTPSAEVYANIEADLLDIVGGNALPDVAFYNNNGYVTRAMAQTLLAQVYLQWAGQPLNGGDEYYQKAADAALMVISGGAHSLEQPLGSSDDENSAYNVIKTSKTSDEIIYAREYDFSQFNLGNSYACRSIGADAFTWGVFHPAGDVLYNAYLPCNMLIESYEPWDIRGHEKQFFFWEYTDSGGELYRMNNIGNWAWFDETSLVEGHDGDYNMPIFRYAEVLLIAAEGLARTGEEGLARGYLNEVRTRAGVPDTGATGDELIQVILTERLHELPLEFRVWDDIRRTRLYPEEVGSGSGLLNWVPLAGATIQNKPDGSTRVGAIPEFALLWPIPLDEIQANPSLEGQQNPGWQ